MSKLQKIPTGPFHPGYGCAIFIIVFLTFSGILTWTLYTFLKQDQEFSTFTIENAPELPKLAPTDELKTALRSKLAEFGAATSKNRATDLSLTIADLNTLLVLAREAGIGGQDGSVNYTDMLRFTRLIPKDHQIAAVLRNPVRSLPWKAEKRFIVGEAIFEPVVEDKSFDLKLISITVPGKTVNEGFLNGYRSTPWLSVARLKPDIAAALGKITSFEFAPDGSALVLHAAASSAAVAIAPQEPAAHQDWTVLEWVIIFGCCAGFWFFVGKHLRRK